MKILTSLGLASAITVAMAGCTKPAQAPATEPAPPASEAATASTPATSPPETSASTMPEPTGTGGLTNTLNVTYECEQGGDLKVRYAGVSDLASSTASLALKGVQLTLPRKDKVWDDGTYMLSGDDDINLSKAPVFVFQHLVENVNGKDMPTDRIIMKNCRAMNATP